MDVLLLICFEVFYGVKDFLLFVRYCLRNEHRIFALILFIDTWDLVRPKCMITCSIVLEANL